MIKHAIAMKLEEKCWPYFAQDFPTVRAVVNCSDSWLAAAPNLSRWRVEGVVNFSPVCGWGRESSGEKSHTHSEKVMSSMRSEWKFFGVAVCAGIWKQFSAPKRSRRAATAVGTRNRTVDRSSEGGRVAIGRVLTAREAGEKCRRFLCQKGGEKKWAKVKSDSSRRRRKVRKKQVSKVIIQKGFLVATRKRADNGAAGGGRFVSNRRVLREAPKQRYQ